MKKCHIINLFYLDCLVCLGFSPNNTVILELHQLAMEEAWPIMLYSGLHGFLFVFYLALLTLAAQVIVSLCYIPRYWGSEMLKTGSKWHERVPGSSDPGVWVAAPLGLVLDEVTCVRHSLECPDFPLSQLWSLIPIYLSYRSLPIAWQSWTPLPVHLAGCPPVAAAGTCASSWTPYFLPSAFTTSSHPSLFVLDKTEGVYRICAVFKKAGNCIAIRIRKKIYSTISGIAR